jgi:hypothetical protein
LKGGKKPTGVEVPPGDKINVLKIKNVIDAISK